MRSVALPLPSSPHWAPTSTIAGIAAPLARAPGEGTATRRRPLAGTRRGLVHPTLSRDDVRPRFRSAPSAREGPAELEAGVDAVDGHQVRDPTADGAQADAEVAGDGLVLQAELEKLDELGVAGALASPDDRRGHGVLPGEVEVRGVELHGQRVADDGIAEGGVVPAGQGHDRRVTEDRELGVGGGQDPLVLTHLVPHRHPALALRRGQRARRVDRALLLAAPDPVLVGAHRALVERWSLGDGQHVVAQQAGGLGQQSVDDRGRDGVGDGLARQLRGPERDAGDPRQQLAGRGEVTTTLLDAVELAPELLLEHEEHPSVVRRGVIHAAHLLLHWVAHTCQWHPSVAPPWWWEARWDSTAEVAGNRRVGVSWREGSARVPVGSSYGCTGGPGRF